MRSAGFLTVVFLSAFAISASGAAVTFNEHIAPIIYQNCSSCHRPGEAAPFALLSYDDVKKKAKTVAAATKSRQMPPWKAEPASFAYRDERRLTEQQIALIQAWVNGGMEEGAGAKPTPPQFSSGWALGEPDLIVEMPKAYQIPAEGPDIYRNIAVPFGLTEDKWITAIEMKSTARSAVHHVLYFADPNGKSHQKPQQGDQPGFKGMRPGGGSIALGGFAVGAQPKHFPQDLAIQVPKGSDLVVQYHFHPTGKPEAERARIGLHFAKKPPERKMVRIQMPPHYALFSGLDIPAGEKDFVIRDSYTLPVAVDAVGMGAHAHYIARQMKLTATLPDGDVKTLLSIKDWDFAWQDRYYFKDLVALPAGTRLDAEIHWDNSSDNPRNPSSPPVRVRWGEESKDEMGSISLIAVARDESQRPALQKNIAEHQNKIVAAGIKADPMLLVRLRQLLAE